MATPLDISVQALDAAAADAAAAADEEARAAGINPPGLLKRVRRTTATNEFEVIETVSLPGRPDRSKQRGGSGAQAGRRKLGG